MLLLILFGFMAFLFVVFVVFVVMVAVQVRAERPTTIQRTNFYTYRRVEA